MSSDRFKLCIRLIAGLTLMGLAAGCQVRPLYSHASGASERLASVSVSQPQTRVDQVIRNHLVFLASGGTGQSVNPAYDLKLTAKSTASSVIEGAEHDDDNLSYTGVPVPGRVQLEVSFTLTRRIDGQVLKSARRETVSQIDVSRQGFAKLRAVRDAENRAAREAAEFVRTEVSIALEREPHPQTTWQK